MKVQLNPKYDYNLVVEKGQPYLVRSEKEETLNIPECSNSFMELQQAIGALHELIQLAFEANKGWTPNFKDHSSKYVIISRMGEPTVNVVCHVSSPMVFNSMEAACKFFETNLHLITKALPVL